MSLDLNAADLCDYLYSRNYHDLQTFFFQDIDCMPLHPLENFPESLRQQNIVNEYYSRLSEANEDQMKELGTGGLTGFTSNLNSADATFHIPPGHPITTLMKQAKVECLTWKLLLYTNVE